MVRSTFARSLAVFLIAALSAVPGTAAHAAHAAPDEWDAPVDISDEAANPRLVTDGTTITALWFRLDGGPNQRIQSASTTDAGASWSVPVTLGDGSPDGGVQLVTDGTTITAVWARSDGGVGQVQSASSSDAGLSWSGPVTVSDAGLGVFNPQLVTDGTTITAVWFQLGEEFSRIQSASSSDAGASWSTPVTVSDAAYVFDPQLVTDGDTITAMWVRWNGGRVKGGDLRPQTASSTDAGASWSTPVNVLHGRVDQFERGLVTDGDTITAVFRRFEGDVVRIESASSTDDGASWSAPVTVFDEDAHSTQLVTDGTTITAMWARSDGALDQIQSASSTDGGASWSVPVALTDAGQDAFEPQLVTDGTRITAVWSRLDSGDIRIQSAFSIDAGSSWSVPVFLSDDARAYHPQLVTDGDTITAVWSRIDESTSTYRIQTSSFTAVAAAPEAADGASNDTLGWGILALAILIGGALVIGLRVRGRRHQAQR